MVGFDFVVFVVCTQSCVTRVCLMIGLIHDFAVAAVVWVEREYIFQAEYLGAAKA